MGKPQGVRGSTFRRNLGRPTSAIGRSIDGLTHRWKSPYSVNDFPCFVRYVDDFVLLAPDRNPAQQALSFAHLILLDELGLSLSKEKTSLSTFKHGFSFLDFQVSSSGISARQKSVEKFKHNFRSLTIRSRNLDRHAIIRINRAISGFAHYFATPFSSVKFQFRLLDHWIRRHLRYKAAIFLA